MTKRTPTTTKPRVLIVDDDPSARANLKTFLESEGYATSVAADGAEALEVLGDAAPAVVISDLQMPNMDGMQLLEAVKKRADAVPVIIATSVEDLSAGIAAMRAGAADYLTKPVDLDALLVVIERVLEGHALRIEAENLRRQFREREAQGLQGLIGASPVMQKVYRTARQVASSRATVLITGESGTGKGELARAIHALGARADKPFITLHCAALAETLLESELFGHEKGSFTGADKRRVGRFEQAEGGTVFLDEIGEIQPATQIKLLRFLQERAFERVGGNETVTADVRVVAATNRDLAADVAAGRFREDLYYRLNVVHIEMPPLRLRGGDIITLAEHFVRRFAAENHKRIDGFTAKAREKLLGSRWPGNVRALENAMERAVVLAEEGSLDADDLPFEAAPEALGPLRIPGATLAEIERYAIVKTLEATDGSTARAAELLDISVRTIQYRLHEYGMVKK